MNKSKTMECILRLINVLQLAFDTKFTKKKEKLVSEFVFSIRTHFQITNICNQKIDWKNWSFKFSS